MTILKSILISILLDIQRTKFIIFLIWNQVNLNFGMQTSENFYLDYEDIEFIFCLERFS